MNPPIVGKFYMRKKLIPILPAFLEDALEGGSAILSGTPEGDSDGGNAILEWLLILEWCRYVATEFEI